MQEIASDTLTFSLDFKPKATGTYAFCFDNKKSRFETKKISLDIRNAQTVDPVPLALNKNEEGKLNEGNIFFSYTISFTNLLTQRGGL